MTTLWVYDETRWWNESVVRMARLRLAIAGSVRRRYPKRHDASIDAGDLHTAATKVVMEQ